MLFALSEQQEAAYQSVLAKLKAGTQNFEEVEPALQGILRSRGDWNDAMEEEEESEEADGEEQMEPVKDQ